MAKKPLDDVQVETFYPSEVVPIDTLRPWPRNYKEHGDQQTALIGQGLKDFGQFKNIVVWRGPNDDFDYIVAGHGLVESARLANWRNVEVKRLPCDWSIVQVESALVADNVTAELSVTNTEKLADLLQSIRQENPRMLAPTGYDSEKVDAMLRGLAGKGEPVPTLDQIEQQYGEQPQDAAMWPKIELQVSPTTKTAFEKWLAELDGDNTDQKLSLFLADQFVDFEDMQVVSE